MLKIKRAEQLISGLGGEKVRWSEQIKDLDNTFSNIVGDVLLSSAIIAYLGAFTSSYRQVCCWWSGPIRADTSSTMHTSCLQDCIKNWIKRCRERYIPVSKTYSLISVLGDAVKIREWQICGLPIDTFSIDNSLIALNSSKWYLMLSVRSLLSLVFNLTLRLKLQATHHRSTTTGKQMDQKHGKVK
jgi:dynein heavy chain